MDKEYFLELAKYNQTMNNKLLSFMENLSEATLFENRGAFFGSIFATMVHICVGDSAWLRRFAQFDHENIVNDLPQIPKPKAVNELIFSDFANYKNARIFLDNLIIEFITNLNYEDLSTTLNYKNFAGQEFSKNFAFVLAHFFNHQTHHRGQVSTLFMQLGIDIGVTDFIAFVPNVEE